MAILTRGLAVQERNLRVDVSGGNSDQCHRYVSGGRSRGGTIHRPRHRRLPSAEGLRPASELS